MVTITALAILPALVMTAYGTWEAVRDSITSREPFVALIMFAWFMMIVLMIIAALTGAMLEFVSTFGLVLGIVFHYTMGMGFFYLGLACKEHRTKEKSVVKTLIDNAAVKTAVAASSALSGVKQKTVGVWKGMGEKASHLRNRKGATAPQLAGSPA